MARLVRESDGSGDQGARVEIIKHDENGRNPVVTEHKKPVVGHNVLVGGITARSYSRQDWWLTTEVTEILEETDEYVKFRTSNSVYFFYF